MKFIDHLNLGVINITPNSFSDTERLTEETNLVKKIKYLNQFKNIVWDVGFESTAPMNLPITKEEEVLRFQYFIKILNKYSFKIPSVISLDSYKLENYQFFYQELLKLNKNIKIIFNDVSGVVDKELIEFLKNNKQAYYVYCFTEVNSREVIHSHMKNIKLNRNITEDMTLNFSRVINLFNQNKIASKLILDPSFGFSKSLDENWQIIEDRDKWLKEIKIKAFSGKFIIGLSKKSFLHKLIDSDNSKEDSELIHYEIISWFRESSPDSFIFRVHDPAILGRI